VKRFDWSFITFWAAALSLCAAFWVMLFRVLT